MKFHQLAIGQRFEFEGKLYVKEGPVAAREAETGKSRMIPRYAVLKPVGEVASASRKANTGSVPLDAVMSAFDRFYAECMNAIGGDAESAAMARLAAARQRFLDSL